MGFDAAALRDFHQAIRIGAVRRTNNENKIDVFGDLLDRFLAVLRGIANIVARRPLDEGEFLAQARHNFLRVVKAQGRLRKEGELAGIVDFESIHGGYGIHHDGAVRRFARGADDLLMVAMADQDNGAFFARKLERFKVNFGDQRAGGVNHFQLARLGFLANRRRNAVGAENQHRAVRHFLDGLDKYGAAAAELLNYIGIMNDFVMHVYGGAIRFQREFDDIHGAHDTRAESPRPHSQQYFSIRCGRHCCPNNVIPGDSLSYPTPRLARIRFLRILFSLPPRLPSHSNGTLKQRHNNKPRQLVPYSCEFARDSFVDGEEGSKGGGGGAESGKHGKHYENYSSCQYAAHSAKSSVRLGFLGTCEETRFGPALA